MGTLYLIRHGQASFGTDDYDRLSPLGERQCEALGAWMRSRGMSFEAVLRGTLRRHEQSLQAIARALPGLPAPLEWPGLNEYDSEAVVRAVFKGQLPPTHTAEGVREHFRILRDGLLSWIAGEVQPEGMPTWPEFVAGVIGALDVVRSQHEGNVLLVSSGGPISTAVGHVLAAPARTVVELNLRMRNTAVTEFVYTPKRHALLGFNALPHLDAPERADWITYA